MPKVVDHEELRGRVRAAARAVFAERGLAGTGLVHVAEEAGMGRASLYHYYSSKDELIGDLAEELLAEEALLFARASEQPGTPLERIANVAAAVTAIYEVRGESGAIIFEFWARDLERMRSELAAIRASLAELIEQGQREGGIDRTLDARDGAAMIVALIDGLLIQYFIDPRAIHRRHGLAERIRETVRKMLAP